MQLLVRMIESAVVVPVTAVRRGTSGDYVYVVNTEGRTVSLRPVQRGQATVDRVVITSGLKAGERVITEGADRLKDGASVTLPGDQPRLPGNGGAGGGKRQRPGADGAKSPASASASSPATPASESAAQLDTPADLAQAPQRRRRASQAEGS